MTQPFFLEVEINSHYVKPIILEQICQSKTEKRLEKFTNSSNFPVFFSLKTSFFTLNSNSFTQITQKYHLPQPLWFFLFCTFGAVVSAFEVLIRTRRNRYHHKAGSQSLPVCCLPIPVIHKLFSICYSSCTFQMVE